MKLSEKLKYAGIILGLLGILYNATVTTTIRWNDMVHLEKTVKEIKIIVTEHTNKFSMMGERIARLEGRLDK